MANPFLFMEEEVNTAPTNDAFANPFLVEDDDDDGADFPSENPFSASNPFAFNDTEHDASANDANFFMADDDDDEIEEHNQQQQQQVDPTMSFFGTTINENDDINYHINEAEHTNFSEAELKSIPPQRPAPATQQMINTLTHHLDQTSTSLLEKIPVTRSPSPVSMRDLHSPSPTPDVGDLLDVSDAFAAATEQEQQQQAIVNNHEEHKPNRPPPPPRPVPPRPTPPTTVSTPIQPVDTVTTVTQTNQQQQQHEDDLFDLFGTGQKKPPPKPPAPKTKEDILSLYTPPPTQTINEVQKPDLLSDDIDFTETKLEEQPKPSTPPQVTQSTKVAVVQPYVDQTEVPTIPQAIVEPMQQQQQQPIENHMINNRSIPMITEDMVEDRPQSDFMDPPEEEPVQTKSEFSSDHSPTESGITSGGIPASNSGSILNMQMQEEATEPVVVTAQEEQNPFTDKTPTPQKEQLKFLTERPIDYQHQRPTTPDPIVSQPELAPIFNIDQPAPVQNIKPAKPPPPARISSVLTTVQQPQVVQQPVVTHSNPIVPEIKQTDDFDDFSAKFESTGPQKSTGNAFLDSLGTTASSGDAWGDSSNDAFGTSSTTNDGFGGDDGFDSWDVPAAPESTPYAKRRMSNDSNEGDSFNVSIKPKVDFDYGIAPALAPPSQKSPYSGSAYSEDSSPRVNPFDKGFEEQIPKMQQERRDSDDSGPGTPLFDDDVSQPLEDFPRIYYTGPGWEMQLRQPNKKKITGQRFWKKVFIRLVFQGDNPIIQLLNKDTDKEPFQELPLQGCYSVSEISAQQFDNFGKIFTVKLQYVFYKERPGVRPGQVSKAERITSKLSMFAKYAIEGDYQGVKEFGSDLKKLGMPVEHAPQSSELLKLGSMNYEHMKQFSMCVEEALFKLNVHRDRALTYKMEEVQVTAVDEIYVEQSAEGHIEKQIARVRLFFLGFLSGMPDIELGLNDMIRQGKEVVGRHDIIPVATEEWIRLEGVEFHSCVQQDQYERTRTIKFKPPDACYIELMRFRVRPPKNRELPLQLKATWVVTGNKVQLKADVLVPGFTSRKLGQIPCEDVAIRFPIPECWIYLFRVEKHFRYGSVKSTHRRTGKIKGIERFLGTVDTLQESLIEVTSGQAKYEHHHRAIVWRCPRLPKEGQGAYTTHQLICRMALTSFDQIPDQLAPYAYVEFTMPATQVSHTTVRSVSVQESESDDPPEKYVRYLARHEYRVGIEHTMGESQNPYLAATAVKKQVIQEEPAPTPMATHSDSDSDSN
ncbi:hypothetical protein PVAND_013043 [Polypedilum vanderplanki]|uniref:Protein stoned-B n=1 Tax=Polypedilum vanderplanki TaxID=319348 RepID=A0A9J6CQ94_POLVA|nr:hypothetical protein PVAND_013043 [Polypedilum vanderplanki]